MPQMGQAPAVASWICGCIEQVKLCAGWEALALGFDGGSSFSTVADVVPAGVLGNSTTVGFTETADSAQPSMSAADASALHAVDLTRRR
jgi:hypothetical protein